jgi:hypothetical protein
MDAGDCSEGPSSSARRTARAPEFRHEALMQRDAFGMPDLVPVVIDHPLSTLSDAKSDRRAEQAIPQCLRIWLVSSRARARDCY